MLSVDGAVEIKHFTVLESYYIYTLDLRRAFEPFHYCNSKLAHTNSEFCSPKRLCSTTEDGGTFFLRC